MSGVWTKVGGVWTQVFGGVAGGGGGGGAVTEDDIAFYDEFIGTSFDWMWRAFGAGAGKTISIASSKVSMAVTEGTLSDSQNGRHLGFYTGSFATPVEYICKLSNIVMSKNTGCVLFASQEPFSSDSGDRSMFLFYYGDGSSTFLTYAENPGTSGLPGTFASSSTTIYLKIRMIGGIVKNQFTFWISTDGVSWSQLMNGGNPITWTNIYAGSQPWWAGFCLKNWSDGGAYHAISCDVEWFKAIRPRGIRA